MTPQITGRRRLALNSASATTLNIVNIVVAFVMSPIVVSALGDRIYGAWEALLSIVGYFGILDAGIGPAVVRYVALADGKGDRDELSRVLSPALAILTVVGLVAASLLLFFSRIPEIVLKVSEAEAQTVSVALVIIAIHLLVRFPGAILDAYCLGRQRHYVMYCLSIANTVGTSIGIWYFLTYSEASGLIVVASFRLFGGLIYRGSLAVYVLSDRLKPTLGRRFVSMQMVKELYTFGFKSMLLMVSNRILESSMPIIITHSLGIGQVVYFVLANKVVMYASRFVDSIASPLVPYFSSLSGERGSGAIRTEWLDLSRFLQFLKFGFALAALFLGVPFLSAWMGDKYATEGEWIVYFLSLNMYIRGIAVNSPSLLVSLARHERAVRVVLPSDIAAVLLAILLSSFYGLNGIAASITLAGFASTMLILRESCSAIGVSMREYLLTTTLPNLFPSGLLAALLYCLSVLIGTEGYLQIILVASICGVLYLSCGWVAVLKPSERQRLLRACFSKPEGDR